MTKGIAGIGKTVSVKKFILDWADGKANQGLDFIFMFPFRELNLVKDDNFSLEALVKEFHPELNNLAVAKNIAKYKVLFIFDGLDESQLSLNFQKTKRLTDPTKESSVDTLVTNLIREHLLPSALVWITSRPGAVHRIPKEHVYQWTEVKGFKDPQKIMYFRNRIQNKVVAEKIIDHIKTSRSLFIMCHIPVFCWIASKVLESFFLGMGNGQYKNTKTPTTLIEMYTHFFCIQIKIAAEKYDKESLVFHSKKLYCFVHLTVQEYFAALFRLKDFLILGKTGELDIFLRFLIGMSLQSTQDLLQGLIQQTEDHSEVVQSIRTSLMEIDLLDCSPDRCLNLVHCLAELKDDSLYDSVKEFLNPNRYPENQLTPVQCSALADLINYWITDICNEIAAAFKSNASNLRELELSYTNFRDSDMEILSVALMNTSCTLETLRLSHNKLTVKGCETLASAISSRPSSLKELDLSYNDLHDAGIEKLCNALTTSHCVLKALWLVSCLLYLHNLYIYIHVLTNATLLV
uniref:NACHT domain-containing protein n=1 Tax=Cyprinodon variegatus TaxID=28743 RepID=A0A3Q2GKL3_CYPVA